VLKDVQVYGLELLPDPVHVLHEAVLPFCNDKLPQVNVEPEKPGDEHVTDVEVLAFVAAEVVEVDNVVGDIPPIWRDVHV
jgi:hypothetical protein